MPELPEGRTVRFGDTEFTFSVATTGVELMKGLGGVTSLDPYDGMLFDFGTNFSMHMWAKGLTFPIDVAFLDEDGTVTQFGRLDPGSELSFTLASDIPGRYALEVPVGFFETHDITVGSKFDL